MIAPSNKYLRPIQCYPNLGAHWPMIEKATGHSEQRS
ncbi:uncharacterized protein METZ01_LOCUS463026, partial [marine metagenome]